MNDQYGRTANTAGKKEIPSSAALALAVGLALAFSGAAAMAYGEPIPGIDIIVQKNPNPPGPISVVVPNQSGNFSLRLTERGDYTVSTACQLQGGCLPHKLSAELKPGAGGEPSIIAILIGLLLPAQKASAGGTTFDFTVGDRGVVLSGQFQDAAGVRVAVGDINQDGRAETRTAAPKKAAGKPGIAGGLTGDNTWTGPIKGEKQAGGGEVKPGITGGTYLEIKLEDVLVSSKIAENNSPPPQNRGTDPRPGGEDEKLPGLAGEPIPGVDVNLGKNPGGIVASSKTDKQGNFHFDKLPTGDYELIVDGQRVQTITVGENRSISGTLRFETVGSALRTHGLADHGTRLIRVDTGDMSDHGTRIIRITNVRANANQIGKANQPIITKDVDGKLPGLAGEPIPGVDVNLGKNPGGIVASSKTDNQGNFHFDKLPAGNYQLKLPGLSDQSLTVGADGIAGGKLMRGPDGSISIFDRWGNRTADSPKGGGKTAEKPAGFGSGNTMGVGPGGMGLGGGMAPPGAGPAMGGAGPAMGGAGPMGGPGSAMKNR